MLEPLGGAPSLAAVRVQTAALQTRLLLGGLAFRAPPLEPTTCCGKGCQGCVWEGFYAASAYWVEGAQAELASQTGAACPL